MCIYVCIYIQRKRSREMARGERQGALSVLGRERESARGTCTNQQDSDPCKILAFFSCFSCSVGGCSKKMVLFPIVLNETRLTLPQRVCVKHCRLNTDSNVDSMQDPMRPVNVRGQDLNPTKRFTSDRRNNVAKASLCRRGSSK